MPIYEYECTDCGEVEEAFQKISDKPLTKCRHCSGKLHKLISQSSFHLKGSGWYVTDYGGGEKSKESAPKPAKGSENASGGKAETASESAPKKKET
ncbi:MAG: zinc ribbon domain-containing protein [Desulfobacteraceae bacterium]